MILYPTADLPRYSDAVVSLDGLLLGVELDGVAWIFDTLDGWSLGAGVQTTFAPRPTAHGEFDGPAYRRSRVITLGGTCVAPSAAAAEDAMETLAATMADGRLGTISVQTPTRSQRADVRLSDTPQAEWLNNRAFRFALQFTAPDPRKYGSEIVAETGLPGSGTTGLVFPIGATFDFGTPTDTGRVTVVNTGTAPTEPVFTVEGPLAYGFEVTHVETGRRLRYSGLVGGTLVLDARTGRASVDGQDRSGNLTVREWPVIDPKATATFAFSTLGSETASSAARLTISASPAYF